MTSHDVVAQLRRRLGERRVGHAGTLDPGATGVLVVGVGMVTRLLRFVTEGRKSYVGEIVLGIETDTLDADGRVIAVHESAPVDVDRVRQVITTSLVGDIEQLPPMVSAISVGGRRLHELARQGIEIERQARPVTVYRFDVASVDVDANRRQVLRVEVDCSAGTYVRVLAADLGRLLGAGAHLRNLRRVVVEPFTIDEAAPPDVCELLPPIEAVRSLAKVVVDEESKAAITVGKPLPSPEGDGPWAMVSEGGELLAVYEPFRDALAKPAVVLSSRPLG